jgi:quercetin dioxygenase-like cupin family protein
VSNFAEVGSLGPQQIWEGVLARSVHGSNVTLALLELDADSIVPEHAHANEQLGILLSGSLRFTIGGEARDLMPGAAWRILAHVPHSVEVGPDGAVVVEAFAPARDDWDAIEQQPPRPSRLA